MGSVPHCLTFNQKPTQRKRHPSTRIVLTIVLEFVPKVFCSFILDT